MVKKENEFLRRLRETFKIEASEHVNSLSLGLIELEKAAAEKRVAIVETIFREAHSLKGAARSVNISDIAMICQSLESIFAALKRKELDLSKSLFDILHQGVDHLGKLLAAMDRDRTQDEQAASATIIQLLEGLLRGTPLPVQEIAKVDSKAIEQPTVAGTHETIRIHSARLESLLLQIEEMLSARLAANQMVDELREMKTTFAGWESEWRKVSPDISRMGRRLETVDKAEGNYINLDVRRLLDFLDWNHEYLKSLESKVTQLAKSAERDRRSLNNMVDGLTQHMKQLLMSPFSTVVEVFPKFVRDLAREQGKELELIIQGQELEIDRRILEEMKSPLTHLVRNSIDHGIEVPEVRKQKGKPPNGKVILGISQKGSHNVEITVADDGAGIDIASIRASAVKRGVVAQDDADKLSELEALSLIYQSGVSTSPIITDISGRGLGLTIVREKVEKIHGTISVTTEPDRGTTFRIVAPITLAEFRGVVIRVGEHFFVIPTTNVERAIRVKREVIKTAENRQVIDFGGQVLSVVWLADVLELPPTNQADLQNNLSLLILGLSDKRIAFVIDEIVNEQEVLVKGLGRQLSRVRNIAGASITASGKIVLVLNISDLIKAAIKFKAVPLEAPTAEEAVTQKQNILVVEDSITARTLLKNILESAGYRVKTAVDGVDAFTILKTEEFDLLVSDVDMPRMNGFDLTAKVRADKKLSEMPVVLVTALESKEHRERGIDVGASAYIVKSSFDQSNLLEVIRRLI